MKFRLLNMKLLSERLDHIHATRPDLEGERGQTGLIRASGASKSVVNQWLMGKIKSIDIRYALAIERNLGFSHIWLMTGEGDPRDVPLYGAQARAARPELTEPVAEIAPAPKVLQWVSSEESTLLTAFRSGTAVQQRRILGIATGFASKASRDEAQGDGRSAG